MVGFGGLAVGARAKSSAATAEDHHLGLEVGFEGKEKVADFLEHHARNGVQALRAVEPDSKYRPFAFDFKASEVHDTSGSGKCKGKVEVVMRAAPGKLEAKSYWLRVFLRRTVATTRKAATTMVAVEGSVAWRTTVLNSWLGSAAALLAVSRAAITNKRT